MPGRLFLFLVFIVWILFGEKSSADVVVFSAESSPAHNAELVGVANKTQDPNIQLAAQHLIRFLIVDWEITPKWEGHRLSRLQYSAEIFWISPFVWALHRKGVYVRVIPIHFAVGLDESRLSSSNIHNVELSRSQFVRMENYPTIEPRRSNHDVSYPNAGALGEKHSSAGIFGGSPANEGEPRSGDRQGQRDDSDRIIRETPHEGLLIIVLLALAVSFVGLGRLAFDELVGCQTPDKTV